MKPFFISIWVLYKWDYALACSGTSKSLGPGVANPSLHSLSFAALVTGIQHKTLWVKGVSLWASI